MNQPEFLIFLITLAGIPAAVTLSGILCLTKLKAPTIGFSPTVTPIMMTLGPPIQQILLKTTFPSL